MKIDELSTNKETLEVLFDSNNEFIIPAYQRPYEWKTDQVEKLLDNICEAYSINKSNKSNENDIFVLGTVQFKKKDKDSNKKEIIDGHQRITTLYLLKKYLGCTPSFSYKNEINNSKSIDDLIENDNLYKSNYTFIEKYFSKGEANKLNKKDFVDFLNKKIVFISISIIGDVSIDDTLKLFDSLNTTGLSLQVKDIFKISFSDYLEKNSDAKNKAETIRNINEAYDRVVNPIDYSKEEKENKYDSIYCLEESDLLDSYRFYLISQMKDSSWAVQFRQSNSAFFEEAFQNKKKNITVSLIDFCNLSKCIKDTQNILRKRDLKEAETEKDMILSCSRELLDWSGYSRLKNLYYYIVFDAYKHNDCKLNDNIVKFADKVIYCVWRYCSIFRFVKSKIVNVAFNHVGAALFKTQKDYSNLDKYVKRIEKNLFDLLNEEASWCNEFAGFKELLTPEGNVKDCNKPHLLMFLSYLDDAWHCDRKLINTRGKIGYWIFNNKQGLEIEHILSNNLYNDEKYVNSIGNLMYLQKSINRALGKELTKYNGKPDARKKDFENKIKYYRKDSEELASVNAFLNTYENDMNFIKKRNNDKIDFLKKVYNFDEIFNN